MTDGNVKEVESEKDIIHVKYDFYDSNEHEKGRIVIYALSKNDGKSWFFIEADDYFNDYIFPESKRLIRNE